MNRLTLCCVLLPLLTVTSPALASQPLETETARTPHKGVFQFESTYEIQTSSEGQERAAPMGLEYGLLDNLELLVEPVLYTSIRPKGGAVVNGIGDLETTLTYRFLPESEGHPAFAVAGEVKLPTAKNRLIGTGKTDYAAYIIASKRIGRTDVHGDLGYTVVGKMPGVSLKNTLNFATAAEYHLSQRTDLVAEFLANSASTSTPEGGGAGGIITAEASGGELVGMVGGRWKATPLLSLALGVTYDNNNALLVRPGVTFEWK